MSEDNGIKRAKGELDKISQDEKERRIAELREKAIMDEIAIRDSGYNDGYEEGKASGRKAGMKEGKEIGMQEGKEIGMQEGKFEKQLEIANNLLKMKMDIKDIAEATGLSIEEIENLK